MRKEKRSQINEFSVYLQKLEKQEEIDSKVNRRKKMRSELKSINKTMKEQERRINVTKILLVEKINKIDKPLAVLIWKKREKTQLPI